MKTRLLSLLAATVILVGCSNQEAVETSAPMPENQEAGNIRSYDEALEIARKSISLVDGSSKTRASSPRKISVNDTKVCLADTRTRTSSCADDTLMYVFNFEDNQGFAIVSANRNTEALIAVTEQGFYDPEVESDNEGFNYFMERAKDYVTQSAGRGGFIPIPETKDSVVYSNTTVGPYLTVNWGQTHPEGEYCSNGMSGYANTAIAQIMSYYESPLTISLTYPNADISVQYLNWTQMKSHQTGHGLSACPNQGIHRSIGRLLRQLGALTNSSYNTTYTQTYNSNIPSAVSSIGYQSCSWTGYNYDTGVNHLNSGHLLLLNGQSGSTSHHWVFDGYITTIQTTYHFEKSAVNQNEWILVDVTSVVYSRLCHYNWGWYGDCNGYFLSGVFNTQSAELYENQYNTVSYNFGSVVMLPVYP